MKKLFLIILLIIPLLTLGAACDIKIGKKVTPGGGVFKSANQGNDWLTKSAIPMVGNDLSITNVNALNLVMDPQDHQALYLGTLENGLFYTYNGAEGWSQVSQLNKGKISAIMVDPADKCNIYAATGNKILKSIDCSRSWQEVYFETRVQQEITDLSIDAYNPKIIYAGTSVGDLLKSTDGGKSWATIERFKSAIERIVINYSDTRVIYIATHDKGIFKTVNGGTDWLNLEAGLKGFPGGKEVIDLIQDKTQRDVLIAASKYGLLKTADGGTIWQAIELLTPPNGAVIYSLAIDPKNGNNIYYGTATTFYKSIDGGKNWVTKKLPTDKAASVLLVDFADSNVIYLGSKKLK